MTIDEIKLANLRRLMKRDGITSSAELGRRMGFKGNSAKSTGSQINNGIKKIVGETLKRLCAVFEVGEDDFLKPAGNDPAPAEDWKNKYISLLEKMDRLRDELDLYKERVRVLDEKGVLSDIPKELAKSTGQERKAG